MASAVPPRTAWARLAAAAHLLPRLGVPTPVPVPVPVGSGGPLEATTGGAGEATPLDRSPSTAGEGEGLEGALLAASQSTRLQPFRWMSRLHVVRVDWAAWVGEWHGVGAGATSAAGSRQHSKAAGRAAEGQQLHDKAFAGQPSGALGAHRVLLGATSAMVSVQRPWLPPEPAAAAGGQAGGAQAA